MSTSSELQGASNESLENKMVTYVYSDGSEGHFTLCLFCGKEFEDEGAEFRFYCSLKCKERGLKYNGDFYDK